jgi:hypothetical protein
LQAHVAGERERLASEAAFAQATGPQRANGMLMQPIAERPDDMNGWIRKGFER